jgi:cell division inhibitor SepF
MAGVWKKTLSYLGLVEEDGYQDFEDDEVDDDVYAEPAPVRKLAKTPSSRGGVAVAEPQVQVSDAIVRTIPARPAVSSLASGQIHRAEPKRFNEARELGDRFKEGVPVIMNLQGTEDSIARRLVDFASGLVFGLDGKIEMVANRVYLLTPAGVDVSAEERERMRDAGALYNQF